MPGSNGTAAPKRRVYSAVPRTSIIPIEVIRDGTPAVVEFVGQHQERPEVWAQIEMDAARERYLAEILVPNDEGKQERDPQTGELVTPEKIVRPNEVAHVVYRREMLQAVLRDPETGEPIAEADTVALVAARGGWDDILTELGWWDNAPADEGGQSSPEAVGEGDGPTGDASSPKSAASTTSPTTP